jgi:transmembrane sensor
MNKQDILALLARYESGACTPEEQKFLEDWYAHRLSSYDWNWENEEERTTIYLSLQQRVWDRIYPQPKVRRPVWHWVAAASFVIASVVGAWWWSLNQPFSTEQFYVQSAVTPGSQAAQLTLEDGKTIRIDEMKTGEVYRSDGVLIKKLSTGELIYEVQEDALKQQDMARFNTISIPRGGQFQFLLPDGSKVWLNSATSITYPIAFVGEERTVTLLGEAYFEIKENPSKPFRVKANHTDVVVTGTRFNVSAFPTNDEVLVTLASGGVQIEKESAMKTLTPGQQSTTSASVSGINIRQIDVDYALAWVEGQFLFEDQTIQAIMEDVARWYNVDVVYTGKAHTKRFGGTYSRNKSLEDLLQHLESLSSIRFKVEERRVTVMM